MDKKYIEEHEIEIKYLRKQLTDEELEAFEIYLMENPQVVDDLNLDQVMTRGVSGLHEPKPVKRPSFMKRLFGHGHIVNALGSFVLGLVVMAAVSMERDPENSPQLQYLIAQGAVRGSDELSSVEFEFHETSFGVFSSDQFVVILDTPSSDANEYEVDIYSLKENTKVLIKKIESLVPNSELRIVLLLQVSDFKPGQYEVRISSLNRESVTALFRTSITQE